MAKLLATTVNTVYELQEELIACFSQLVNSRSTETVSAAVGLKRMIKDFQFLFWLKLFFLVMPHDNFYSQIRAKNIDAVRINQCVSSFEASVQKIRDACDTMDVGECNRGSNARRSAVFAERRREAKEVCDVILFPCQKRFQFTGHLESSRLLDSSNFISFLSSFLLVF